MPPKTEILAHDLGLTSFDFHCAFPSGSLGAVVVFRSVHLALLLLVEEQVRPLHVLILGAA